MNKPFSSLTLVFAAVALAAVNLTAVAAIAQTPQEIVNNREEGMKKLGRQLKAIMGYIKADEGTAEDVVRRAREIGAFAAKIPSMFPDGTEMNSADSKYQARPELWLDWENFEKAAAKLEAESKALAAAADTGDKAAIAAAYQSLGKNGCTACHDSFRMKVK